jgi:hypothetical protein
MKKSWRKVHNEELHNTYSSPNASIVRMMKSRSRWSCITDGEKRNAYGIVVEAPEGKRDHYGDIDVCDSITLKLILEEQDGVMDWIDVAQNRGQWTPVVNTVINFWVQ